MADLPIGGQIALARAKGYSDEAIAQHLIENNSELAPQIRQALGHYSAKDILTHLATPAEIKSTETPDPGFFSTMWDAAKGLADLPGKTMDFITGHPLSDTNQFYRDRFDKVRQEPSVIGKIGRSITALTPPGTGEAMNAAADEFAQGHIGAGTANTLLSVLPFAARPALEAAKVVRSPVTVGTPRMPPLPDLIERWSPPGAAAVHPSLKEAATYNAMRKASGLRLRSPLKPPPFQATPIWQNDIPSPTVVTMTPQIDPATLPPREFVRPAPLTPPPAPEFNPIWANDIPSLPTVPMTPQIDPATLPPRQFVRPAPNVRAAPEFNPIWKNNVPTFPPPPEPPIQGPMPGLRSGAIPGHMVERPAPATPPVRPPIWQGAPPPMTAPPPELPPLSERFPRPTPPPAPPATAAPATPLPQAMTPPPAEGASTPLFTPEQIDTLVEKAKADLKAKADADKYRRTDLNRAAHAIGSELDLPEHGSPTGTKLSMSPIAQTMHGADWMKLSTDQMNSIVEFMLTHRRPPTSADITSGLYK